MGVPFTVKIFIMAANTIINRIGFTPFNMNLTGTLLMAIVNAVNSPSIKKPQYELTKKINIIIVKVNIIFVLGSDLCNSESPGTNWPMVISLIIILLVLPFIILTC